jgi:hypothetical protein
MGLLSRLFKSEAAEPPIEATPISQADCLHAVLLPHWDSADDLGHRERVESYMGRVQAPYAFNTQVPHLIPPPVGFGHFPTFM